MLETQMYVGTKIIQAVPMTRREYNEYRGWELTRVRLYTDGSRRVLLRRRKTGQPTDQPGL